MQRWQYVIFLLFGVAVQAMEHDEAEYLDDKRLEISFLLNPEENNYSRDIVEPVLGESIHELLATPAILNRTTRPTLGKRKTSGRPFSVGIIHRICPCGANFDTGDELKDHIHAVHSKWICGQERRTKSLTCPADNCEYETHNMRQFLDHAVLYHTHEKVEYTCPVCPKTFNHWGSFKEHQKKKHQPGVSPVIKKRRLKQLPQKKCACGEDFCDGSELENHIEQKHTIRKNNRKYYYCPIEGCDKSEDKSLYLMVNHYRAAHTREEASWQCPSCAESFISYSKLRDHETQHRKSRRPVSKNQRERVQTQCACKKDFGGLSLEEHIKQAHRTRIDRLWCYKCPTPNCQFKETHSINLLLDHFRARHTHELANWKCAVCQDEFTSYALCMLHERKHRI